MTNWVLSAKADRAQLQGQSGLAAATRDRLHALMARQDIKGRG